MNKAVTEGLILMPPPFADGLNVWSSGNGTPGSATYDGAANAAFVPSDPDFEGCLELLKTSTSQKLRWMGQSPILPGCYLRVTAKVKAVSGPLPNVQIAGFPADAGNVAVPGAVWSAPEVSLTTYGEIVEVSAIIGTGSAILSTTCDITSASVALTPIATTAKAGIIVTARRNHSGSRIRKNPCIIN